MFILLLLLTSSIGYTLDMNTKLMGKVIVIDAGHGGKDSGTLYGDILEKDLNLDIALKLRDELVSYGVTVVMVRDGDYDLSSKDATRRKKSDFDHRIQLINHSNADLYISIHMNYLSSSQYYGAQVFYTEGNEILANTLQNVFKKEMNTPREEKQMSNDLYLYKRLTVPGVLIECGFLSNANDRKKLVDSQYQEKFVQSIVKGLLIYY